MDATGFLLVRFCYDRSALVSLLQHEARVSHAYRALRRRNTWHAAAWGLVLSFALGVWVYARSGDAGNGNLLRPAAAALVFSLLWAGFIGVFLSPRGFFRLVDAMIRRRVEQDPASVGSACTVMLLEEGIVCEGSQNTLALWSEVERVWAEEDGVYFDLVCGRVLGIPRDAFAGDIEYRRFVEFACARLVRPIPVT
jgi:hypothetical protein